MKRVLVSAFAVAATACFSYGQAQQQNPVRGQTDAQQGVTAQQNQQNQREEMGPEHVQKCIREAASDNQFEIQAGQFVEQRSQNQQVKQFAQRLAQDHQKAEQQLQQMAQQAGQQAVGQQPGGQGQQLGGQQGTQQMNQVHQAKLQELQQKQGMELDRAFIFDQIGGHEKDVLVAMYQSQHEQNPQLKQYAQQQLPVLEEHLRMARQIAEQWVPQARQAGEMMRGQMRDMQRPGTGTGNGTGGQGAGGQGTGGTTGRNSSGR